MTGWECLTLDDAVSAARLSVTVLDKRSLDAILEVSLGEYGMLCNINGYHSARGCDEARRPTEFTLTIMRSSELRRRPVSVEAAIRIAMGYMGRALEDTASDRKQFGKRIAEADFKRRGGEVSGSAGTGRGA